MFVAGRCALCLILLGACSPLLALPRQSPANMLSIARATSRSPRGLSGVLQSRTYAAGPYVTDHVLVERIRSRAELLLEDANELASRRHDHQQRLVDAFKQEVEVDDALYQPLNAQGAILNNPPPKPPANLLPSTDKPAPEVSTVDEELQALEEELAPNPDTPAIRESNLRAELQG